MIDIRRSAADTLAEDVGEDVGEDEGRPVWEPLAGARLPAPEGRGRAALYLDGAHTRLTTRLKLRTAAQPLLSGAARADRAMFELMALCHLAVEDSSAPAWLSALTNGPDIEPHGAYVLGALCHLAVHYGKDEHGKERRRLPTDGSRTWWQLAAGAGDFQAAYTLALLAASHGDQREARHWHDQARQFSQDPDIRTAALAPYNGGLQPAQGLCPTLRQVLAALPSSRDADFGRTPAIAPHPLAAALHHHQTDPRCHATTS
ncbi:hypothetical protein [Kitasatospora sp. HPMI-4]|uniref:hypothetical protein n=1 Tax=Kitasatospora sp. HPMI-4 TaxID=3448443 RepID=UPI003F1B6C6B